MRAESATSEAEPAHGDKIGSPVGKDGSDIGRSTAESGHRPRVPAAPFELTVIVPTFNERDNVRPLIEILAECLDGIAWEAIFVDDDSPDDTAACVRELIGEFPNVRCIQRIGRRGLSSACVEGMLAGAAPYLAVVDADMQHDLGILPLMLHELKRDRLEIVIGSRYVDGGGTGNWARSRVRISELATRLGKRVLRGSLKDPMSGFFVLDRRLLDRSVRRLSGKGFKILLDIFLSVERPVRFAEIGYVMRSRVRGSSKLDASVAWQFLMLIMDKLVGRVVPIRFVMFVTVGMIGAAGHLAVLGLMTEVGHHSFVVGQSLATVIAMTINFLLNNVLTYRDRKLHGWAFVRGLASFYVACGLGALINVVVARFLFDGGIVWWMSGLLGALIGSVWNFTITSSFTWKRPGRRGPGASPDSARRRV